MNRFLAVTFLFFALCTIQVHAQASDPAYMPPSDWNSLKSQAVSGDAYAQVKLGVFYSAGSNNAPQDYEEAAIWFRKAAEAGNADGQLFLGGLYHDGHGVKQNYAEAEKWLRKAAEQGNANAQTMLQAMHAEPAFSFQQSLSSNIFLSLITEVLLGFILLMPVLMAILRIVAWFSTRGQSDKTKFSWEKLRGLAFVSAAFSMPLAILFALYEFFPNVAVYGIATLIFAPIYNILFKKKGAEKNKE